MSIEMDNPGTLIGKIDAAWNYVEQIGLALGINDIEHVKRARGEAVRLLSQALAELQEEEYSGVGYIATERRRQIEQEGWTPEHDDAHGTGELVDASLSYIRAAINVG
ncbi:MAG TPA: hypothetical protein PLA50_04790, partial [Bacteroidia bacterium]|nr:hypothetical protein [Bacteroidia bacterium]